MSDSTSQCMLMATHIHTPSKVRELSLNLHRILLDTVKMQEFQDVSALAQSLRVIFACVLLFVISSFVYWPPGSRDAHGSHV